MRWDQSFTKLILLRLWRDPQEIQEILIVNRRYSSHYPKSVLLEYWYRNTSSVHLHKGASNREEKRTWLRRFARLIGRVTLRNMRRPKMLPRIPTTGISHLVHARHSPGGFFFFRVTVTLGKYTDHNCGEIWRRSTRIILCHLTIASSDPRPRMLRTIKISESIIST